MIPLTLGLSHGVRGDTAASRAPLDTRLRGYDGSLRHGHPLRGRFASTRPCCRSFGLREGDGFLSSPRLRGLYTPSRTPCEHRFACSRPPRFAKGRVLR